MLVFLNLMQLVLYIALLALLGQGVVFLLAGAKRDSNVFYKLLQVISKPFTALVRKITPAMVADAHVPVATFLLLLVVYAVVTFEKINHCMSVNMVGCK